jgi:hypothetical protein
MNSTTLMTLRGWLGRPTGVVPDRLTVATGLHSRKHRNGRDYAAWLRSGRCSACLDSASGVIRAQSR